MQILIKGARVLDPGKIDGVKDILIKDGKYEAISESGKAIENENDVQVIDAKGLVAVPGLIDERLPGHYRLQAWCSAWRKQQ